MRDASAPCGTTHQTRRGLGALWSRLAPALVALALLACASLPLAGCAPGDAQKARPAPECVGTPWKSWFIEGTLTQGDDVRYQDDYFAAANRDWLLAQNARGRGSRSAVDERADEIADEMYALVKAEANGTGQDRDVANLGALLELFEDWDARDADGLEPIRPLVERLLSIDTLDELTAWLCSPEARLSLGWRAYEEAGSAIFCLDAYNDVSDEDESASLEEGYTLSVLAPTTGLAAFALPDEDLEDVDDRYLFLDAAARVELADHLLWRLGIDDDASYDLIWDAVDLDDLIEQARGDEEAHETELTMAELAARTQGGFPITQIAQAYGYGGATAVLVEDMGWLEALGELYTEKNVGLFVAHEIVSLLVSEARLLDYDAYDAAYDLDGTSYLPEGLGTDDDADAGQDVAANTEDDTAWLEAEERRACIEEAAATLPTTYAKVYVEHFFDEGVADEVRTMVDQIMDEYEVMLDSEDWLGPDTRALAVDKLRAIQVHVGHPTQWPDTSRLHVRTRAEGATLFDEVRRLRGIETDDEQRMLADTSLAEYWDDCMDINAYYEAATNAVFIGAGILGEPYWGKDMSYEQRLGAMGTIIGHEISHAFDSDGAYLDKYGRSNPWWTEEDLAAFEERVERVKRALEAIDPLGTGGYDGEQVCAEAIADLGGIRVTDRIAARTQGFDHDAFFRAYARSWASVSTFEDAEDQLADDAHPLDRDRTNVPLRELDSFLTCYGVTEGDGMWMDPAERVSVW